MRVKLTLQYIGTNYHGWQIQPHGLTIQEVLQKGLFKLFNQKINVVGSGRTDSGVHALGQVAHFDLSDKSDMSDWSDKKILKSINSQLPDDIVVTNIEKVPGTFHAQKSAKKKSYDYFIYNSAISNPFIKDYVWQVVYPLDIKKIKKAAKLLVGEHDFKSFCAANTATKTTVRRIFGVRVSGSRAPSPEPLICISITGNGFLKHMVRNIVGTLVGIGRGQMRLTEFKKGFKSCDRRKMGMAAPAKGLFLREVEY